MYRADWRDRAACGPATAELFFDENRADEARAICAGCPVRTECREYTRTIYPRYGVWAGGAYRQPGQPTHVAARGLTDAAVRRIRERYASERGATLRGLAREYGVARTTVRNYVRGCRRTAGEVAR